MQVDTTRRDHLLVVELAGDWRLGQPAPHFDEILEEQRQESTLRTVGFDAAALEGWDSSLLAFLLEGLHYCEAHDLEFWEEDLPEDIARLIELSRAVPEQEVERDEGDVSPLAGLGQKGLDFYSGTKTSVAFVGQVGIGFAGLLLRRGRFRWRDFWLVVQSNSAGALPIVSLISFLAGLIISFLGAVVLERFGAGYYVSYLVSYGIL